MVLRAKGSKSPGFRKLGSTGGAGECESHVELGAGTVDTTGLIRRASLDVGTSNIAQYIIVW